MFCMLWISWGILGSLLWNNDPDFCFCSLPIKMFIGRKTKPHTYLHVIMRVSWTGITRSSLELSRIGGVIEKPITRPAEANTANALDLCYTGRSGPVVLLTGRLAGCRISATHQESEIRHDDGSDSTLFITFTSCKAICGHSPRVPEKPTDREITAHSWGDAARSSPRPPSELSASPPDSLLMHSLSWLVLG